MRCVCVRNFCFFFAEGSLPSSAFSLLSVVPCESVNSSVERKFSSALSSSKDEISWNLEQSWIHERSWTLATPSSPTILHLFCLRLFFPPPTSVDYKLCVLNAQFFSVHPLFFLPLVSWQFCKLTLGKVLHSLFFPIVFFIQVTARLFSYQRMWLLPLLQSSFYIRLVFILYSFSLVWFPFSLVLFIYYSYSITAS
jgi:hypothetical protein